MVNDPLNETGLDAYSDGSRASKMTCTSVSAPAGWEDLLGAWLGKLLGLLLTLMIGESLGGSLMDGGSEGALLIDGVSLGASLIEGASLGGSLMDGKELGEADTLGGLKTQDSLHGLLM